MKAKLLWQTVGKDALRVLAQVLLKSERQFGEQTGVGKELHALRHAVLVEDEQVGAAAVQVVGLGRRVVGRVRGVLVVGDARKAARLHVFHKAVDQVGECSAKKNTHTINEYAQMKPEMCGIKQYWSVKLTKTSK